MSDLIKQLEKSTKNHLIDIIIQLSEKSPSNMKDIKTMLASHDPEKLSSLLMREVKSLSQSSHNYDYNQSKEVSDIIYDVMEKVDSHLVIDAPDLAIKIIKALIDLDKKLFDHIDDSYGNLGIAYFSLYAVLDIAFLNSSESADDIAKYIVETYLDDPYGNRSDIIRQINLCLQGEKSFALERVIAGHEMNNCHEVVLRKKFADLSGDVDKYIEVVDSDKNINSSSLCEIAERLLNADRPQEAIVWLLKIEDDDYRSQEKNSLLVKAYQNVGDEDKAQELRWQTFEKYCYVEDYNSYIENASKSDMTEIENKAIKCAQNVKYLQHGVSFLHEMKWYDFLENLLMKRYDEIRGEDYHTYRSLLTDLAKRGKYLVASLLRRKLAQSGVAKAQSKYYKYAASDYKACTDYAEKVMDWKSFSTHDDFTKKFKESHKRKKAFWMLVN